MKIKSRVSLVKGENRKNNLEKSLSLIEKDFIKKIKNKKIIIKPNFVHTFRQLAATHVESAESVMDFLSQRGVKKFTIAESSAVGTTTYGYKNYDYYSLKNKYNVELIDLNEQEFKKIILNFNNKKIKIRVSKLLLNKNNFVISLAKLKTHDTVVATLSIKNIVMGSIYKKISGIISKEAIHKIRQQNNFAINIMKKIAAKVLISNDKIKMHAGIAEINNYISQLHKKLHIDLAIIDGFDAMQGNGPTHGTKVDSKLCIASTDALAADRVGLEIMQINPDKVGYLNLIAKQNLGNFNLKNISILGNKISQCKKKFKLHNTIKKQLKWK